MIATFQSCLNGSENESKNNDEVVNYTGDVYSLELGNLSIAILKDLNGQNILSSSQIKNINKTNFQDTLITFVPTYFYEKANFVKGSILPDKIKVIDAGRVKLNKPDISSGMIQLVNNKNKNKKLSLTRISIELRGSSLIEKRSINLHPTMESQEIDIANEIIRTESAWLFDGLENFNQLILSNLEFRSSSELVKIENPVLVNF